MLNFCILTQLLQFETRIQQALFFMEAEFETIWSEEIHSVLSNKDGHNMYKINVLLKKSAKKYPLSSTNRHHIDFKSPFSYYYFFT